MEAPARAEQIQPEKLFTGAILGVMRHMVAVTRRRPSQSLYFLKTLARQALAARRRSRSKKAGLHVPPLMIASITTACNLKCGGCYSRNLRPGRRPDLPVERWEAILREADGLGVSIVMVAGGEPFTRPDWMALTEKFPRILFPVFTNGLLLTDGVIAEIRRRRNLIPVLSVEGSARRTDLRRGEGVYGAVRQRMESLAANGIFHGASITLTSENMAEATDPEFLESFARAGCRLFFLVEYVPVEPGGEHLVLTPSQKASLEAAAQSLRRRLGVECIAFPGDEERYGGCLAAGRGFIHVGPDGGLEPCPFAPYSDTSVADRTLKEALESGFLRAIRDNHDRLSETRGGCALWTNRDWVRSLLPGETAPEENAAAGNGPAVSFPAWEGAVETAG